MSILTRGFQVSTWLRLDADAHELRYELDRLNQHVCIHFDHDDQFVLNICADDLQAVIELGTESLRELADPAPDQS